MIRALGLLLALLAGIVAAALAEGRMHHLRLLAGDKLPAWTGRIAPEAGLLRGALTGQPALRWEARWPSAEGLRWQIRVSGVGMEGRALVTLRWLLDRALVSEGSGTLDLAALPPGAWTGLTGMARIAALDLRIDDLRRAPRASGSLEATLQGAAYQGESLGSGPLRAALDPLQSWRASAALSGGVADVEADLTGRLPSGPIGLRLRVADSPDLPEDWRRALETLGEKTETGWSLTQRITP